MLRPGAPSLGLPSLGLPSLGLPSLGLPSLGLPSLGLPSLGLPSLRVHSTYYTLYIHYNTFHTKCRFYDQYQFRGTHCPIGIVMPEVMPEAMSKVMPEVMSEVMHEEDCTTLAVKCTLPRIDKDSSWYKI